MPPTQEMQRLTISVQQVTTVVDSSVALLNGIASQVRTVADDPAAVNALADQLDAEASKLAAAVAANTPAA